MAAISIFDLFSIGIGPSSSHTVGPMTAAHSFINTLEPTQLDKVSRVRAEIYGSLAHTGKGHGTDNAILMGLQGELPETVDPDSVVDCCKHIRDARSLKINGYKWITYDDVHDFIYNFDVLLPLHTNGMMFQAFDKDGDLILKKIYYSIGGGFIVDEDKQNLQAQETKMPFPFENTRSLLNHCREQQCSIAEIMMKNELTWHSEIEIKKRLLHIFGIMQNSIDKGCHTEGILPGGLNVKRRAFGLYKTISQREQSNVHESIDKIDWLSTFAIAVNEENAAGGRIVTAPTNGAAGIVPSVLTFYKRFYPNATDDKCVDFLLTAGAIAILFKKGASISGAEVGCQGEVGVAASMAAAGLTAVLGGTIEQVENAAEIAIEHHLGMTCDPVAGLVQIPCIERNAMGAIKAVSASRLALMGSGEHKISLDKAIATVKQTGHDMMSIYKETSLGGLAANHPEC